MLLTLLNVHPITQKPPSLYPTIAILVFLSSLFPPLIMLKTSWSILFSSFAYFQTISTHHEQSSQSYFSYCTTPISCTVIPFTVNLPHTMCCSQVFCFQCAPSSFLSWSRFTSRQTGILNYHTCSSLL